MLSDGENEERNLHTAAVIVKVSPSSSCLETAVDNKYRSLFGVIAELAELGTVCFRWSQASSNVYRY